MPITDISGEPTVQASGQHRGTITVTFDDGRIVNRNMRAPDRAGWDARIAAIGDEIQAKVEASDARRAVSPTEDIAANDEASIAQTCIAYIRRAWTEPQAYDAGLLYSRINTYVTNHSDWATAHTHLIAAGLSQEEYDQAKAAYQYLSGSTRPAALSAAQIIQNNWEAQH
jgi:hypothetical protein